MVKQCTAKENRRPRGIGKCSNNSNCCIQAVPWASPEGAGVCTCVTNYCTMTIQEQQCTTAVWGLDVGFRFGLVCHSLIQTEDHKNNLKAFSCWFFFFVYNTCTCRKPACIHLIHDILSLSLSLRNDYF